MSSLSTKHSIILVVGESGDTRSSAQSSAIDSVIQQILAGTANLENENDIESKKRDLNKVSILRVFKSS